MADAADSQPRTVIAGFVVSLVGLAASGYLTYEHFTSSTTFACPESATINCAKVTTSQWSHVAGIPVAVLGLVFFVAMTVLCWPGLWRVRALDLLRVAGAVVGVLSALYLLWIELFRVDAICLWCTAVHICTVLLLGCVLWTTSELRAR
ncbi:MAG: vitamin K epoxide reductase family protein [Jatrophihabitantaceae bacterium]